MNQLKLLPLAFSAVFIATGCECYAQCNLAGAPAVELRTPLINGAYSTIPGMQAPMGQPPAIGDGSVPAPVNPGHLGPPTLIPSVTHTDGGIGSGSYSIPFNPATTSMPGQLGPSMYAPPPPSTPGYDPGMIYGPRDFYPPPVTVTNIMPGGGIAGSAPTSRWGGQTSRDFGRYKHSGTRKYEFGQGLNGGQTAQDGPWQTLPGAVPTQDRYGNRVSPRNGQGIMTIAPY